MPIETTACTLNRVNKGVVLCIDRMHQDPSLQRHVRLDILTITASSAASKLVKLTRSHFGKKNSPISNLTSMPFPFVKSIC